MKRKPSTVKDYRIIVRRHFGPFFQTTPIERITPDDITSYIVTKSRAGLSIKTITNHLNFAHGVFRFAVKRGLATSNPVAAADRPRVNHVDPDIRFLSVEELEALLRAVSRDDLLGPRPSTRFTCSRR